MIETSSCALQAGRHVTCGESVVKTRVILPCSRKAKIKNNESNKFHCQLNRLRVILVDVCDKSKKRPLTTLWRADVLFNTKRIGTRYTIYRQLWNYNWQHVKLNWHVNDFGASKHFLADLDKSCQTARPFYEALSSSSGCMLIGWIRD